MKLVVPLVRKLQSTTPNSLPGFPMALNLEGFALHFVGLEMARMLSFA